jgi:hypothetical protein
MLVVKGGLVAINLKDFLAMDLSKMKKKILVTKGHLAKDTREAKEMVSSAKKIVKLGKEIIKTDVKARSKK